MSITERIDIAAALEDDAIVKVTFNDSGVVREARVAYVTDLGAYHVEWERRGETFATTIVGDGLLDAWIAE